jgi:hypothetical protein
MGAGSGLSDGSHLHTFTIMLCCFRRQYRILQVWTALGSQGLEETGVALGGWKEFSFMQLPLVIVTYLS